MRLINDFSFFEAKNRYGFALIVRIPAVKFKRNKFFRLEKICIKFFIYGFRIFDNRIKQQPDIIVEISFYYI